MTTPALANNPAVSPARFRVWKLMEFAGILSNKKRRVLTEELDRKFKVNELESDERRILAAERTHPNDKRERMRYLRQELKAWERRSAA